MPPSPSRPKLVCGWRGFNPRASPPTFLPREFDLKLLKAEVFICKHWEKDIPILNPGDWFGKARVLSIEGGYVPLRLVVEADDLSAAIDVLADHETYKREVLIPEDEYRDYGTRVFAGTVMPGGRKAPEDGWLTLGHTYIPDSAKRTLREADFAGNDGLPCRTSHVDELGLKTNPGIRHNILYAHPDWTELKTMSPQAFYDFLNICSFESILEWVHKYTVLHLGETEVNYNMGVVDIIRGGDKGECIDVEEDYPEIYRQYQRAQAKKS